MRCFGTSFIAQLLLAMPICRMESVTKDAVSAVQSDHTCRIGDVLYLVEAPGADVAGEFRLLKTITFPCTWRMAMRGQLRVRRFHHVIIPPSYRHYTSVQRCCFRLPLQIKCESLYFDQHECHRQQCSRWSLNFGNRISTTTHNIAASRNHEPL
jgi:hypothetical protein